MEERLARSNRTVVEVRVDGAVVGRLSPKMSAELLPAVRHLASLGTVTVCRAILKGNTLKADVVIHTARANQISQEWLNAPPIQRVPPRVVADHLAEQAKLASQPGDTGDMAAVLSKVGPTYGVGGGLVWRFNPPPGWPPPPDGWSPPPGWRPDPSWPPAPSGWQFWVAVPA